MTSPGDWAANHSECKLKYTLYLSQMIATLYRFTNVEDNRLTENKLTQELFLQEKKLGNARWTIKDKTKLTFGTPRNLRN